MLGKKKKQILPNGDLTVVYQDTIRKKIISKMPQRNPSNDVLFPKYLDVPSIKVSKWLVNGL